MTNGASVTWAPRRVLRSASFACMLAVGAPAAAQITVGPNAHVSSARSTVTHDEVLMAADPNDANHLLACSMVGRFGNDDILTATYVSFDGGASWSAGVADSSGTAFDPSCAFGPAGTAYFTSAARRNYGISTLRMWYSTDAGRSWHESAVPAGSAHIDRPYVVADYTGGKYHGRVYVYAQIPGYALDGGPMPMGITLWRSLDGGATLERPIQRFPPDRTTAFQPGNSVILSDGTFAALFAQLIIDKRNDAYGEHPGPASRMNGSLKLITSHDGGETLDSAITVSDMYADWREAASTIPSLAADASHGPFRDRLYAVWADGRFGGRTQIVIAYSADGGRTWSAPKIANDDRQPAFGSAEHIDAMPTVAVNKDGVVGVSWYDRRESRVNGPAYIVRFAASFDGGDTFTPSVRVSDGKCVPLQDETWMPIGYVMRRPTGADIHIRRWEWLAGGHTAGIAADANGVFHPLWIDDRTGIHQVYTAPITVRGVVARNGSVKLATLDNVSSLVTLEVTNTTYDRAKRIVTVTARLKNTATDTTVRGPFKVRAVTLTSDIGVPLVLNATNGTSGDGAVWDFSDAVRGGVLLPGDTSAARPLRFRLTDLRPFHIYYGGTSRFGMIDIDTRILAHRASDATHDHPTAPAGSSRAIGGSL